MKFKIFALIIAITLGFWSTDTITGETELREVTATFALESDHINYLTIVDEHGNVQVLETTDTHPFWVVTDTPDLERAARSLVDENGVWLYHANIAPTENGFWVEAKDLREGDVFLGANGELTTLVAAERVVFPEGIKVYNFTVDGNHNYFVIAACDEFGQTSILVHNATNYSVLGGNPSPLWGKNRLIKGLHDEGFKLKGPSTSGGGLVYRHPTTGETYRIMPKPDRPQFRNESGAKFENDFYYRYQSSISAPPSVHATLPNH